MFNGYANGVGSAINVYGSEWERIERRAEKVGNKANDVDYKGFDVRSMKKVHDSGAVKINEWYEGDDKDLEVRKGMVYYITNAEILVGSWVYRCANMMPSGHWLTMLFNNLFNHFLGRLAWVEAHGGDL